MKFEEVLPALRAGKAIRRKSDFWSSYIGCYQLIDNQLWDMYEKWIDAIDVNDLLADDWEIVEQKKKVKLRDLTWEQYIEWVDNHCQEYNDYCDKCPFQKVKCEKDGGQNSLWINNKDLYSDKFLDQEIEIEEE